MVSRAKKGKIAIHIQSEVQFFSLAPLLDELKKNKYDFQIVTDLFEDDESGYKTMAEGVKKLLKANGYTTKSIREFKDVVFDVYLTTFIDDCIKAKCYLKYEYGTLNIKPNLTYLPYAIQRFHGFLCQSTITNELLKVYGATFPVDNLRFWNKKKTKHNDKKTRVLFAPTYNEQESEEDLVQIIKELKKEYYVIVKGHHGTDYLKENKGKKDVLMKEADEYYGSDACLSDLILSSDVCLFGNSSAIGEALYAGVPCAVFAKDLDYFKMEGMHTTQYYLVKDGILPYTNRIEKVDSIIKAALSDKCYKKQKQCSDTLFPSDYHTGVDGYIKVIDYFINDCLAQEYCALHDYAVNDNIKKDIVIKDLNRELNTLKIQLDESRALLERNSRRKLYKVADKIYKIRGKK